MYESISLTKFIKFYCEKEENTNYNKYLIKPTIHIDCSLFLTYLIVVFQAPYMFLVLFCIMYLLLFIGN